MKKLGILLLASTLLGLSSLLIAELIPLSSFVAISVFCLLGSFILILGPETISEITIWKASIKRDVRAAKEFRDEAREIRDELRRVTKIVVEDAYILASSSFLAMPGKTPAKERIENNMSKLSKFVEPEKEHEENWWEELQELFADRRK